MDDKRSIRVGINRYNSLDEMNEHLKNGDVISAYGSMEKFLSTIRGDNIEQIIKEELDSINNDRKEQIRDLEIEAKNFDDLVKFDMIKMGKAYIKLETIKNMRASLWTIAMKHNLFND